MASDGLVRETETWIIQVHIIELLAHHEIGEEAASCGDQIGPKERHFEIVAESGVVGRFRTEVARRSPEMQVPAVPVEAGDVCANLSTGEGLTLGGGASG